MLSGSGWGSGMSFMNFGVQGGIVCPSHSLCVHYSLISGLILCLELLAVFPWGWTPQKWEMKIVWGESVWDQCGGSPLLLPSCNRE